MATAKTEKLSASLEDYLEAIYNLSVDGSVARSKNIAQTLEVSQASVTGALRILAEKQLVNYKPYGYITLTKQGCIEAQRVVRKHNIIEKFFVDVLGVEHTVAQKAACEAEHAFGPQIVEKLLCFIEFVNSYNKNGYDLHDEFRSFFRKHGSIAAGDSN